MKFESIGSISKRMADHFRMLPMSFSSRHSKARRYRIKVSHSLFTMKLFRFQRSGYILHYSSISYELLLSVIEGVE